VTLQKFATEAKLATLQEVPKACHLAFYHLTKAGKVEFTAADCAKWLDGLHLPKPNTSRLTDNLKKSKDTVKGTKAGYFRLHATYIARMEAAWPHLSEKSQEVLDHGTVLPQALYQNTRGFIESIAKQINRSYEENIFDGCAVLMRRLEEMLLILSYEKLGIANSIKDAKNNYVMLEAIVKNAEGNATLNLSRNSKRDIEVFRDLGNFSAHKVFYNAKREYIKEKIDDFRALVEELLHKSGLRT
jgi:hypothetical protein